MKNEKKGQGWEASYNEEKKRYEAMVFECSREGFMRDEFIISKDVFDQLVLSPLSILFSKFCLKSSCSSPL
jgi:hypothetical protein